MHILYDLHRASPAQNHLPERSATQSRPPSSNTTPRPETACTLNEFQISRAEAIRAGREFLPALSKLSSKDRQPALSSYQLNNPESICTFIGKGCAGKEKKILFLRYREPDGTPLGYIALSVDGEHKYSVWNVGWSRSASNLLANQMRQLDCD
ncbi:MAG: hypothetical protein KGM24_14530 [Elusimicrobia bacterium]|nr:hypothetical protein [Elusimicrobiota bacterium]